MIANNDYTYNCIQICHYVDNLYGILQFFQSNVPYIISFASHNSPVMWEDRISSNIRMRRSRPRDKVMSRSQGKTQGPDFWFWAVSTTVFVFQNSSLAQTMYLLRGYSSLTHSCVHFMNVLELQAPFFLLDRQQWQSKPKPALSVGRIRPRETQGLGEGYRRWDQSARIKWLDSHRYLHPIWHTVSPTQVSVTSVTALVGSLEKQMCAKIIKCFRTLHSKFWVTTLCLFLSGLFFLQ